MAAFAQEYADNCTHAPSNPAARLNLVNGISWISESLYITSVSYYEGVAEDAIQAWYDLSSDYNYTSNTCEPGKACELYKQVNFSLA